MKNNSIKGKLDIQKPMGVYKIRVGKGYCQLRLVPSEIDTESCPLLHLMRSREAEVRPRVYGTFLLLP